MVAYANARLARLGLHRRAAAVEADIRVLDRLLRDAPGFDVAFCPHNSIRHLPTPADLTRHLRAVARVLKPRGIYIVGIGLQRQADAIAGEDIHRASRRGVKVRSVFQYFDSPAPSPHRAERIVSFTTVKSARDSRTIESAYDLLCIDPAMWRHVVVRAGLTELAVVDDARARDLPPSRTHYACRVLARPDHPHVRRGS